MGKTPWTEGPYHTAPWGDGSSAPGRLNVLSDTAQTVIVQDLHEAEAKLFAAAPEYDAMLGEAIEIFEGDLVGVEWKHAWRDFVYRAKDLRAKARGDQ